MNVVSFYTNLKFVENNGFEPFTLPRVTRDALPLSYFFMFSIKIFTVCKEVCGE